MKKSGLSELTVGVGPHAVGLQHTDHPFVPGLPYAVADDLTLEENMTLTIDFPSLSMGYGNAHLEDLVRITKTGAEPLASMDGVLVVGEREGRVPFKKMMGAPGVSLGREGQC